MPFTHHNALARHSVPPETTIPCRGPGETTRSLRILDVSLRLSLVVCVPTAPLVALAGSLDAGAAAFLAAAAALAGRSVVRYVHVR